MVFDVPKSTPTKTSTTGSLFTEAQVRTGAQAQSGFTSAYVPALTESAVSLQAQSGVTAVTQAKTGDVTFTQAQFAMGPSMQPQSGATTFTQSQFAAGTPAVAQPGVAASMTTVAASVTDQKRKRDANDVGAENTSSTTSN